MLATDTLPDANTPRSLTEHWADRARAWFDDLRDRLVTEFEHLEDTAPEPLYPGAPGRFELKP
jgi:coproporphyrinogen III oxidase